MDQLDIGPEGQGSETTNDRYAFLTTKPNAEVEAIHPKAMPVILTTPEEVETWMTAPADEALKAAASSVTPPIPQGLPWRRGLGSGASRPKPAMLMDRMSGQSSQ